MTDRRSPIQTEAQRKHGTVATVTHPDGTARQMAVLGRFSATELVMRDGDGPLRIIPEAWLAQPIAAPAAAPDTYPRIDLGTIKKGAVVALRDCWGQAYGTIEVSRATEYDVVGRTAHGVEVYAAGSLVIGLADAKEADRVKGALRARDAAREAQKHPKAPSAPAAVRPATRPQQVPLQLDMFGGAPVPLTDLHMREARPL